LPAPSDFTKCVRSIIPTAAAGKHQFGSFNNRGRMTGMIKKQKKTKFGANTALILVRLTSVNPELQRNHNANPPMA
jgi:hypothetical protein